MSCEPIRNQDCTWWAETGRDGQGRADLGLGRTLRAGADKGNGKYCNLFSKLSASFTDISHCVLLCVDAITTTCHPHACIRHVSVAAHNRVPSKASQP